MGSRMTEQERRKCEVCKKRLTKEQTQPSRIKKGRGRFCSRKCFGAWHSRNKTGQDHPCWKGGKIRKECDFCGDFFLVRRGRATVARFCSQKCCGRWASQNMVGENAANWKGGSQKKQCELCGQTFLAKRDKIETARFCSNKCHYAWASGENASNWRGGRIAKRECEICGKVFSARRDKLAIGKARFCSHECKGQGAAGKNNPMWQGVGKVEKQCEICNKSFLIGTNQDKRNRGRFCSRVCMGYWMAENKTGANSSTWKGGKSFEPYPTTFNGAFKRKIRERDGHTCAICSKSPAKCVHHINYVKDDTIPENCVTLCRSCHTKTNFDRDHWQAHLTQVMQDRNLIPDGVK